MIRQLSKPVEWNNQNKYNSFNSYKGLAYYEHYRKIRDWLEGKGKLPAPVECSLDPIVACNNKCYYCNSQAYLRKGHENMRLSWGQLHDLITFIADWGVKGLCFGGGGESTLNSETPVMMQYAHQLGLQTALVTNGSMLFDGYLREALLHSRWVGISLDAPTPKIYESIRGVDMFNKVVNGISCLVRDKKETHSKVDIAIKVLILPENYDRLYDVCTWAKSLGVDDFHIRPVDLERKDFEKRERLNFNIPAIYEQFDLCHQLEDEHFHVYTVMHKYDEEFHVKHDFKKCLASPLVLQACTDGNCYVCVDHRMDERFLLGSQTNIQNWWGSDAHRALLEGIKPATECSRCTWAEYNLQCEDVVENDRMCLAFP